MGKHGRWRRGVKQETKNDIKNAKTHKDENYSLSDLGIFALIPIGLTVMFVLPVIMIIASLIFGFSIEDGMNFYAGFIGIAVTVGMLLFVGIIR